MKKLLILALALTAVPACQRRAPAGEGLPAIASQAIKVAGDEKEIPTELPHESGWPDDADDAPVITPETKFYYLGVTPEEERTLEFAPYREPHCVRALRHRRKRIARDWFGKSNLIGDSIILARVINASEKHMYCEDGKLSKYDTFYVIDVDVLYSFYGPIKKGRTKIISAVPLGYMGFAYDAIFTLYKTSHDDFLIYDALPIFFKEPLARTDPGFDAIDTGCTTVDIPGVFGELDTLIKSLDHNIEPDPSPFNKWTRAGILYRAQKTTKAFTQTHGVPGAPCNIEEDRRREEEKFDRWLREREKEQDEIDAYTAGKRVPCDTCPSGYYIEDLEISEYLKKRDEITTIIRERRKRRESNENHN